MWKTFDSLGVIVDLYIAKKRNRWGKRFGFVRFIKVSDSKKLEEELNGIWIGSFRLLVNLARYNRRDVSANRIERRSGTNGSVNVGTHHAGNQKLSYAAAVKGLTRDDSGLVDRGLREHEVIDLVPSLATLTHLESSLIGELISFEALNSFGEINALEGWSEVRLSYLGGLSIQLEFISPSAASKFLEGGNSAWKDWFSSLEFWNRKLLPKKRIALIELQGIPLHVWNKDSLVKIGNRWGEVVNSVLEGDNQFRKSAGHVYVLSDRCDWIMETVDVRIEEHIFRIRAVERFWDNWETGEIINSESESESAPGIYSDEESLWEGSCREDIGAVNSPEVSAGVPLSTMEGLVSPAPSKLEEEKSLNASGTNVSSMQAQVPSMGKGGDASTKEHVSESGDGACGSGQGDCGAGPICSKFTGPLIDSPIEKNKEPELGPNSTGGGRPNRGFNSFEIPLVSKGLVDDAQSVMEESEGDADSFTSGNDQGWPPQAKIDGLERRWRRTKKWKKMKSPCNCARRLRGWKCKHDRVTGCAVGEAFVGNRDSQSSSDSELLIKRSNKRNMAASPKKQQGNSDVVSLSFDSSSFEWKKLVEVGEAIGVRLNTQEVPLKASNGIGDECGLC